MSMQQSAPFFRMTDITKSYLMGGEWTPVLKGVSLSLEPGEFLSILGPSGSGKSTLMNLIGCLDTPTSGEYLLRGRRVDALSADELARIRNRDIGFVCQSFQLLPRLNALSNVELPLVYAGVAPAKRRERAEQMLERVGLADRMRYLPNQLSGGQQQRVAIARALVTNPAILLADEPTGALDQRTGGQVMDLFSRLHQEGRTLVMITHDPHIARRASRLMRLLDGELSEGAQEDA